MQQDDALSEFVELLHRHVNDGLRIACLEVEGVEIAGEYRNVAFAEIGYHFRRMLQRGEAEERGWRNTAQGPLHRTETFFDLFLALILRKFLIGESGV